MFSESSYQSQTLNNNILNHIYLTCYSDFGETFYADILIRNIHFIDTLPLCSIVYFSLFDPYKYAHYMLFYILCSPIRSKNTNVTTIPVPFQA